jgi:N utilization substance protein B
MKHEQPMPPMAAATNRPPRRRAREYVVQGLYQWRVGGADEAAIEAHVAEDPDFARADRNLFQALLRGILGNREEIVAEVAPHVDRPFEELSPVEACILMLAAYELAKIPETPYRVIINEAIELAKTFGGTDGHKYVNGVLDKIAAKLRPVEVQARRAGK